MTLLSVFFPDRVFLDLYTSGSIFIPFCFDITVVSLVKLSSDNLTTINIGTVLQYRIELRQGMYV